jgi:trehalose 6-phosphate synthase
MNLVAKEYCASSVENNGVLILSEFAGAADQLGKGALLVNPYDVESTADAIHQAFVMDSDERRKRMRLLRNEIRRNDVHRWLDNFIQALYFS